jgi:hypothetical protein
VLELNDEPSDGLAHLLKADDTDGLDARGSHGSGGGGPCGLVNKALGADVLANGIDELLGVVARDAKRAPSAPWRGHRSPIMACTMAATSASPRGDSAAVAAYARIIKIAQLS